MNYAPKGYQYNKKGNLMPDSMTGTGIAYAPYPYIYDKQGNLQYETYKKRTLEVKKMTTTERLSRVTGQIYLCNLRPEMQQIVVKLQELRRLGNSDAFIMDVIKKMNLPLGMHLALTGKFSDLMNAR